jgi:hypothetical protein
MKPCDFKIFFADALLMPDAQHVMTALSFLIFERLFESTCNGIFKEPLICPL